MRHHADKLTQTQDTDRDLNDPHQNNSGKEILDPMFGHQGDHHDGQRTGGTRDHAGSTTDDSSDQTDHKGCVKSNQRFDSGYKGEGHRLGY